ncbi:shikimate dehydrogenase [Streptomyces sp. P01-B04]|uniref:shikimate dehydrogenase n=1 Tax=Streptomyces poriferorum TaxID=2798799 RepID=UPI001C5FE926|nr:shikimate dehydrogenase [Streptomyces poriferorum]MBW5248391.1 shikimate dehydrogenase [Streptomyces poriferorum]MBW5260829.1 shikimate dehydrogenase [Streptomyces poriferorum]
MTAGAYLVGLIGAGISTSLSPALHEREADRQGLRYLYKLLDLDVLGGGPEQVGDVVRAARDLGYDGLNITHPCKQTVIPHLDALDTQAAALGAVNTIVFRDGLATGHNTDVTGFGAAFTRGLPGAPVSHVVQIGAGGAGAAVAHAMLTLGTGHLTLVDMDESRARSLAASLKARFPVRRVVAGGPRDLARELARCDGLVHATPTGMSAHPGMPFAPELLHPGLWVAEVVYRPLETRLLAEARALGCTTLDGSGMVALQAADAFRFFTRREPDVERMLADVTDLARVPGPRS